MTSISNFAFAAVVSLSALAATSAWATDGTNRDPDTGVIICSGKSYCDALKVTCSGIGTWEDATQKDGAVLGTCTPSAQQRAPTALKTK